MERSFIMVTAVASALMFAGVWKATAPAPVVAGPVADTYVVTVSPAAARPPTVRRGLLASSPPASGAEPYNVVRTAYGSSQPARRSGNARAASSAFYGGCREARAAGVTPLHRGDPGYRIEMDGDGDGIACEDYRR
jgi:hypothetical protein